MRALQRVLCRLPVLICSASGQESDVEAACGLGANGCIVKPTRPSELAGIARLIKKYWLETGGPPPACAEWQAASLPRPS